jgi:hypothetical protein
MRGHDPGGELVSHDSTTQPSFEADEQECGDRRPQDARLVAMIAPRRDRGGEDQEADRDAEQTVDVLRPHQRGIELSGIELRREVSGRRRRDPRSETARPVGTSEPGARRAHEPADENQEIGRRRRPERQFLEGRQAISDHI